ncbi:MAG TPA: glycosyltransferase [Bacteroidales bacterium]|nr:glycosyltransferase [Bacteroidales bacterium]
MKLLFVIDTLTAGGKERRLTELMKALKLTPDIEFELALMSTDVHYQEVYDLGIRLHFFIRRSRKDLAIFTKFYNLCRRFKPDIVHCWDSMTAVYITPVCKILRIKLVNGMVIDSPRRRNIFYQPWLRAQITFPFADVIIGNSMAGLKAYKAPEYKSIVIYNGFNFERINSVLPNKNIIRQLSITTEYIVGMVATYSDFKDYPTYYRAAQLLLEKRKDVTFLAIGKNTDSESSWSWINEENRKYFRLLGRKSGVESFINIMDIGILATFTEGISNSILEYMAMSKPVIATLGGGTGEIVVDNVTGILVSQSDPEELAEKIDLLLNDKDLRERMGSHGKSRIQKTFSIEHMSERYVAVYRGLVDRKRKTIKTIKLELDINEGITDK